MENEEKLAQIPQVGLEKQVRAEIRFGILVSLSFYGEKQGDTRTR